MQGFQALIGALNHGAPFSRKLKGVHETLLRRFVFIDRIAVALYDPKTDMLKTFVHSSGEASPLTGYQARLGDVPSLSDLWKQGKARVINDLSVLADSPSEHTRRVLQQGYRSSYTMPMLLEGKLVGFLFFDSCRQDAFGEDVIGYLDLVGHLVSLIIINELTAIHTLVGTVQAARTFTHLRDVETGAHLDRMSRYARLVAAELAPGHGRDDEFVEHVFLFAPLHDIGKIGIPDSILLKPAALAPEEAAVMRSHVRKGREMVDTILGEFGLTSFRHVGLLRNIVQHHHEAWDGGGYPDGLGGEDIPLEARIVAVADVFDALTSRRPYKPAWSVDRAIETLRAMAGSKFDPRCVDALVGNRAAVEEIRSRFTESTIP